MPISPLYWPSPCRHVVSHLSTSEASTFGLHLSMRRSNRATSFVAVGCLMGGGKVVLLFLGFTGGYSTFSMPSSNQTWHRMADEG